MSLRMRAASASTAAGTTYVPPTPNRPGITVFDDYPLAELARYIDWTPFFSTWELAGNYPAILDDQVVGVQARELFKDAQAMLAQDHRREVAARARRDRLVAGRRRRRRCGSVCKGTFSQAAARPLRFLRQQADKPAERPDFCSRRLHRAEGERRSPTGSAASP